MMNGTLTRNDVGGPGRSGRGPGRAPGDPSTTEMDPRIEERRRRVSREGARRRRRRLAAFLAVAIPAVGTLVALRSPLMDVDRVIVEGGVRTSDDVVVAVAGIEPGTPLVEVSLGEVEDRIERLAWVADAAVRREWPGTIRIEIIERTHVAVAGHGHDRVLVDRTGRVLGSAGRIDGVPSLGEIRPEDRPGSTLRPAQRTLAEVAAAIPQAHAADIAELRVGEDGIEAVRLDGLVVVLGDAGHIRSKFDSVTAVLAHEAPGALTRMDVSVPSVPALTRSSHGAQ